MEKIKVEYIKIDDIIPYINNPRKNDHAIDKVASSIKNFGFKNPIIVDKGNEIIAGHTRLKAAKKLGLEEVPVIKAEDLNEAQVKAFRIADNKTAELAEWDFELLENELFELELDDFDLELTGFDDDELDELFQDGEYTETEEDDFEIEEPENPISKRGDIWLLGRHRLMCGDSASEEDVKALMDEEKADMVFTDPPWNVNYGATDHPSWKLRTIKNDAMSTEEFKKFMNSVFQSMNKASKEGCMTYVVMSAQEWGNLMLTLAANNYHWSSTIIWVKDRLVLSRKDYHTQYEPVWYGWKNGETRLCPLKDRKQSDVWKIERPHRSDLHPTMKPIELVSRAIQNSSKTNNLILDLFGGSGSTLIAAEQLNRICYMMELDEKYVDVIVDRYINYKEDDKDVYLIREGRKISYNEVVNV